MNRNLLVNGSMFVGPVYRDGWRLFKEDDDSGTALTRQGAITPAAYNALKAVADKPITGTTTHANGFMELGAGDALELKFLGTTTQNTTINYHLVGYTPAYNQPIDGDGAPVAWIEQVLAQGVITLGNKAAGATFALITGLNATWLFADTITDTIGAATTAIRNTSDDFCASLHVRAESNVAIHLRTAVATAATVSAIARRRIGLAQRR